MLKILSMNHYDVEENGRIERLTDFKVAYGQSLVGVYLYTVVTKKQREAMGQAGAPGGSEATENETKVLVVHFPATGNTKALAETIAELQGADVREIVPEQPYTEEDLNDGDKGSRTMAEQNDPGARPAISGSIEDVAGCDVTYVGHPTWLAYHKLIQCTQA